MDELPDLQKLNVDEWMKRKVTEMELKPKLQCIHSLKIEKAHRFFRIKFQGYTAFPNLGINEIGVSLLCR